jgi:hypothetical protein
MKYVKGTLAGALAFVLASIAYTVLTLAIAIHRYPPPPGRRNWN